MSWKCDNCGKTNSCRYEKCPDCEAPMSESVLTSIIQKEIKLQKLKIRKMILNKLLTFVRKTEFFLGKRKIINICTLILIIISLCIYFAIYNDYGYWGRILESTGISAKNKITTAVSGYRIKAGQYLQKDSGIITDNMIRTGVKINQTTNNLLKTKIPGTVYEKSLNRISIKPVRSWRSLRQRLFSKSFNTIDKSKLSELEELKWVISKIQ